MGLIHFPTTIPETGRIPKKFNGRKVRCIKLSKSPASGPSEDQERTLVGKAASDLRAVTASRFILNVHVEFMQRYMNSPAEDWSSEFRGEWRSYPSRRDCAVALGLLQRLLIAFEPIRYGLFDTDEDNKQKEQA